MPRRSRLSTNAAAEFFMGEGNGMFRMHDLLKKPSFNNRKQLRAASTNPCTEASDMVERIGDWREQRAIARVL